MSKWRWQPQTPEPFLPDPGTALLEGEEMLLYTSTAFATGVAPQVQGRRWYRNLSGHDIEQDLERHAGWPHRDGPTGPPQPVTRDWRDGAAKAAGIGIVAAQVAFWIAVSLGGGPGGGNIGAGRPSKQYMDPATESDDFPVMAADPRSTAAAAPWQLDPDRRRQHYLNPAWPKQYYVAFITLTTRRLLVTGMLIPRGGWTPQEYLHDLPRELLWTVPRENISDAEQRKYSDHERDVIIRFTDGSWLRLQANSGRTAVELAQALTTDATRDQDHQRRQP